MTSHTVPRAAGYPAAPADDPAIGWHDVPGRRGSVRWWNGTAWAGREHVVAIIPAPRRARGLVVCLLAVAVVLGTPLAMATPSADVAFWCWIAVSNLLVAELARSSILNGVAHRAPAGIGRAAWVPDPAGAHELRWWDGHRHSEWVADADPALGGESVMRTDPHTGPQFEPPAAAWTRFAKVAWLGVVLAIVALSNPLTLCIGAPAAAVLSAWCTWICFRNARRLHEPVPPGAIVGAALLVLLVPLSLMAVSMWNAIGNAQ